MQTRVKYISIIELQLLQNVRFCFDIFGVDLLEIIFPFEYFIYQLGALFIELDCLKKLFV